MPDLSNERYPFPTVIRSGMKPAMHVLFLFFTVLFFAFPVFLIHAGRYDSDLTKIFCSLIFAVCGLFLLFSWLYFGVLKRGYIRLEDDGLTVKTFAWAKHAQWADIGAAQPYTIKNSRCIGIATKQKLKKQKDTFLHSLSAAYGGNFSFTISLSYFPEAEEEKLYATICSMMDESEGDADPTDYSAGSDAFSEETESSRRKSTGGALFRAFLALIAGAVLNGVILYYENTEFLLIPVLTVILMIYIFNYYHKEETAGVLVKIVLGLLCALPFLSVPFSILFVESAVFLDSFGIWKTITFCVRTMITYPRGYLQYYVYAALFFLVGITSDRSIGFLRKSRKSQ